VCVGQTVHVVCLDVFAQNGVGSFVTIVRRQQ